MAHVTTDYAGILGTLDGETVTMAAFDAALVPPTTAVPLSGLGAPLDSATTTATWVEVPGRLDVADLANITADDVAYWVCAYDPGSGLEVVSTVTLTDPPSYDDETVEFATGVARVERDIVARVEVLEETTGVSGPDPAGSTAGDVWTSTGPSTDAEWATPSGGSTLAWLDDGADLQTYLIDGGSGANLVGAAYTGGLTPVVAAGPFPVMLGTVPPAHRPAAAWQGTAQWHTSFASPPPETGGLAVLIDHDGSFMSGPAGGLWVYDGTGTLTDSDDVLVDLGGVRWVTS